MSIFSQLTVKPWLPVDDNVVQLQEGPTVSNERVGLRFFLATVSVIFMLLMISYAERIVQVEWRPSPQPALLWFSSVLLMLASVAMQWAKMASSQSRTDGVKPGLLLGGIFALAFLASQFLAWRQLASITVLDITNPAIAFFYLITAMHGIHLLGGLAVWSVTCIRVWRGRAISDVRETIDLCTVYWHYLLVIWLILFGLLFSGNDNLAILLAICGVK